MGSLREAFGLEEFSLWSDLPSYMVFGAEAVTKAYLKAPTFSNEIMMRVYTDSFGASINGMDAPEHTRYRRLFQQAFMPAQVLKWGAHLVPEVVNRLIDSFAGTGKAELVRDFTSRYPFDVVYAQLGLPPEEGAVFQKLAVGLMCILVDYPHAVEASRKMGDYLLTLLHERRSIKSDDIVTMLAQAEVGGERLPDDIAVSFLRQLLNASGDTTYRGTSSLLVGLLTNPDQLEAVRADRSLIDQAIDEALRWDGPLTAMTRQTLSDVELMGVTIPAGSKVDIVQASLNRDPSRYPDPDKFDIFRERKRHSAFALGPHVCIGQHLARIEMDRAVNALLDRLPNLRLDPDYPPPQIVGFNSRAPLELRVLFDA
ncbi:cytochrome P450 [Novosphingobium taihuense]|uniref:Cytochrome P450 n=1 Tax=Novosphingobium taihuense TaxID=260085 RepID=A0A7W7EUS6_9SPHN|nr:cytochrome P450 [Novosphingobium taihuense]MBB4614284.1 cytochrome P450 [Novosphingobium taihuense]